MPTFACKNGMEMNRLLTWIGICCLLIGCGSCRNETREERLIRQAEALWRVAPDSASLLLDSILFPEELSRPWAAEWAMLSAHIADSLDKPLPYPELMQKAVSHYRSTKQRKKQAEAALFWARSLVADKSYERAMQVYEEALETALEAEDFNQAGYICSYMADLYKMDGDPLPAIRSHEQSNHYFLLANNKRSYAFGLVNEAFIHMYQEENQYAADLLQQADSVAELLQDNVVFRDVYNGLGAVYKRLENYDLAEHYIRQAIQLDDSLDLLTDYLNLSAIYQLKKETEKAWQYLEKANQPTPRPFHEASICYYRYLMEKEAGDFQKALDDYERYVFVLDSVNDVENQMSLQAVSEKYKRTQLQSENRQLKISRRNLWLWILGLCLTFALVTIVFQDHVRRKDLKIKRMNAAIYRISAELQRRKEELQAQASLQMDQEKYEQMEQTIEQLTGELTALRESRLLQSSVADRLQKLAGNVKQGTDKSPVTDYMWRQIESLVMEVYPVLMERLPAFGFTPAERRFCYLTLFKLDTAALAVLLNIVPDSVNKQRLRVRQKLHLVGKEQSLYDFLIHFQNQ